MGLVSHCVALHAHALGVWRPDKEGSGDRQYLPVIMAKKLEIEQFASAVVNFSSQYGTLGTSSYTASNLASGTNVYPKYGDYTEAFVLVSFDTRCIHQH